MIEDAWMFKLGHFIEQGQALIYYISGKIPRLLTFQSICFMSKHPGLRYWAC